MQITVDDELIEEIIRLTGIQDPSEAATFVLEEFIQRRQANVGEGIVESQNQLDSAD